MCNDEVSKASHVRCKRGGEFKHDMAAPWWLGGSVALANLGGLGLARWVIGSKHSVWFIGPPEDTNRWTSDRRRSSNTAYCRVLLLCLPFLEDRGERVNAG